MLEQQKIMIESSSFDAATFEAMKAGKQAVDANRKNIDVDEVQEL